MIRANIIEGNETEYSSDTNTNNITLIDAQVRSKGRPTKQQIMSSIARKNTSLREEILCPLCRGNHNIIDCPSLPEIADISLENSHIKPPENRRQCRICLEWGHSIKTCEIRLNWLANHSPK